MKQVILWITAYKLLHLPVVFYDSTI